MSEVAYFDQNTLLAECYQTKSYDFLREKILSEQETYTKTLHMDGEVYGYNITLNQPLTELYGFSCYVVKFVFSRVDTLHTAAQEKTMFELCASLKSEMETVKGYYTMRVPAHIVDLIRAVNHVLSHLIFCGGTVEWTLSGPLILPSPNSEIEILLPDQSFIRENKKYLMSMALESFRRYQSQYHISPVTDKDAGKIYEDWIERALDTSADPAICLARHKGEIVGYCTIGEDDVGVDGVLACVNENKRGLGVYKRVICGIAQYAQSKRKRFVISTQFDNFIVQRAWHSLGCNPYYSIYNIHFDNR